MAHPADLSTPSRTSPAARSPRRPGRRVPCSRDRPAPTGARRSRRPRAVARGPAGPGAAPQWRADGRGAPAGTDDRRGRRGAGAEVRVRTDAPRAVFGGFPRPGHRGYFDRGSVRIQSGAGGRSLHRADARHAFSTVRHKLSWDALAALYFAGCALWDYVSAPFMLTRPGVGLREGAPCRAGGQAWRRLQVSFPADIPAHSREQMFYFDAPGLLRRSITPRRFSPAGRGLATTAPAAGGCPRSWFRPAAG